MTQDCECSQRLEQRGRDPARPNRSSGDLLRNGVVERAIKFPIDELRRAAAVERRREEILIVFTPRPETRIYEFSGRGRSDGCWREPPVQFRW